MTVGSGEGLADARYRGLLEAASDAMFVCSPPHTTAPDGAAALDVARLHAGPIHLLLTDVVMPHMSARELGRRVAAIRPETVIVDMSGFPDDQLLERPAGDGLFFVQRPFTADLLVGKLREAMAPPPAALPDPVQALAIPSSRVNSARTIP